jgi:stage II sporulation protein E
MFYEKPEYAVQCDFFQISSRKDEFCGDCFESFYDGKGNFIAVLSDGMGRGNRAAVDSTMATSLFSRLIVSGFSFPCALRLVNSAMLIKGHEESLATLDILKVNLYNGHSVLYKAGASASLLLRNGKVGEIKKSALPIGLLRQAEFATAQGSLKDEDVIVLMSDGATENSMVELKEYIAKNGYSEDLSEKLCAIARGRNIGHSDDITIATIKIKNGD